MDHKTFPLIRATLKNSLRCAMIYIWHQLSQEPGPEPGAKQQDIIARAELHIYSPIILISHHWGVQFFQVPVTWSGPASSLCAFLRMFKESRNLSTDDTSSFYANKEATAGLAALSPASPESPLLPWLNCPLDKYKMLSGCLHSCHDPPLLLMNARHSDHDYHNSKLSPNSEVGADSVNMGALNQTCKR